MMIGPGPGLPVRLFVRLSFCFRVSGGDPLFSEDMPLHVVGRRIVYVAAARKFPREEQERMNEEEGEEEEEEEETQKLNEKVVIWLVEATWNQGEENQEIKQTKKREKGKWK